MPAAAAAGGGARQRATCALESAPSCALAQLNPTSMTPTSAQRKTVSWLLIALPAVFGVWLLPPVSSLMAGVLLPVGAWPFSCADLRGKLWLG